MPPDTAPTTSAAGPESANVQLGPGSDFFQALRLIEQAHPHLPRIGRARRADLEPVRIHQSLELDTAAETYQNEGKPDESSPTIQLRQRFFGLLGPGGPLPLRWTEEVRDRSRNQHDEATEEFLNLFVHRMASLFYRSWTAGRGTVQHDRPAEDRFREYLLSLTGALENQTIQDARGPAEQADNHLNTRAYFAGRFASQRRNAEGLQVVLSTIYRTSVHVDQFALQHLRLVAEDRTQLGRPGTLVGQPRAGVLGASAILGRTVPDRCGKISVSLGPMSREQFDDLVPDGNRHQELRRLVRSYIGEGLNCRVTLKLENESENCLSLGVGGQLGISSWIAGQSNRVTLEDCHFEL